MTLRTAATDHAGLVVLTFEECLERMAASGVGRVAFLADGEIEVLPVNYTVEGARVAFRSASGSKLEAAVEQAVVAFEVDAYDRVDRSGWSVVIKGRAEVVSDSALIARLERSGLKPFATAVPKPEWVVIHPTGITGRRVPFPDEPLA
jgi:nitroimidazol reductase NimA-like FMN-containing flavoprotein (pyridoxamine 5'-phosphate oxidase superfamily)